MVQTVRPASSRPSKPRINVDIGRLHNVASQFQQGGRECQDVAGNLGRATGDVMGSWEGISAQRFASEFQQWRNAVQALAQEFDGIGGDLHSIADRFAAADRDG